MEDLQELMDDIGKWSDNQFGDKRGPIAILHHLKKEVPELIEQIERFQLTGLSDRKKSDEELLKCFYEFADNFMLLLDAARCFGLNINELKHYTRLKLEINKNREWEEPDENGVVEHIR